jgi:hypothetical protein
VGSYGAKDCIGHGVWIEKVLILAAAHARHLTDGDGPGSSKSRNTCIRMAQKILARPIHKSLRHGGCFGRYAPQKRACIPQRGGEWLLLSTLGGPRFDVELDYRTPKELLPPQRLPFLRIYILRKVNMIWASVNRAAAYEKEWSFRRR